MARGFEDRQAELETPDVCYEERLREHFSENLKGTAKVKKLSYLVMGERCTLKRRKLDRVELAFLIQVDTDAAIPTALQGRTKTKLGDRFTLVQVANSVKTKSHTTTFIGTYTGRDPPTMP